MTSSFTPQNQGDGYAGHHIENLHCGWALLRTGEFMISCDGTGQNCRKAQYHGALYLLHRAASIQLNIIENYDRIIEAQRVLAVGQLQDLANLRLQFSMINTSELESRRRSAELIFLQTYQHMVIVRNHFEVDVPDAIFRSDPLPSLASTTRDLLSHLGIDTSPIADWVSNYSLYPGDPDVLRFGDFTNLRMVHQLATQCGRQVYNAEQFDRYLGMSLYGPQVMALADRFTATGTAGDDDSDNQNVLYEATAAVPVMQQATSHKSGEKYVESIGQQSPDQPAQEKLDESIEQPSLTDLKAKEELEGDQDQSMEEETEARENSRYQLRARRSTAQAAQQKVTGEVQASLEKAVTQTSQRARGGQRGGRRGAGLGRGRGRGRGRSGRGGRGRDGRQIDSGDVEQVDSMAVQE